MTYDPNFKINFKKVSEIITDAVIRANWKNISFTRNRMDVSVIFSNLFLEGSSERQEREFYHKYTCELDYRGSRYSKWNDKQTIYMTEDEWFREVEKHFETFCGIHLNIEEKTA